MNCQTPVPSRLRAGDLVEVISGRDRGNRGRIPCMLPREGRAAVEGIQLVKCAQMPTAAGAPSGIVSREALVHLLNLTIVDPATDQHTRIGTRRGADTDGRPLRGRYAWPSGQPLDNP